MGIESVITGDKTWCVENGDCLEVLKTLPDNSVDAAVTDPPYDLTTPASVRRSAFPGHYHGDGFGRGQKREKPGKGFMGKEWDGTGIAFKVELWQEVLRVLKPGGHLLAFGGTRTYHRMACAIEDAGFEIRDCIQWIYGSGFPKSMDVSKAIDSRGGQNIGWFGPWLRQERLKRGITQKEIAKHFPSITGGLTGCVANWELGFGLPTPEQLNKLCEIMGLPFKEITEAERKVIGTRYESGKRQISILPTKEQEYDITTPATPEAQQWDGWGTALKPANEPIVLARKPLSEATVAANVLKWGTGAINIDGCRIGTDDTRGKASMTALGQNSGWNKHNNREVIAGSPSGRFPANVVLDEEAAAMLDEQSGVSKSTGGRTIKRSGGGNVGSGKASEKYWTNNDPGFGDIGGASRFYYCAKTSQKERGEGNTHPTVKPTSLMTWLCKLVTPPGGIILDPFTGSGSTGIAAIRLGFRFIGIEKEVEYWKIAVNRITNDAPLFNQLEAVL